MQSADEAQRKGFAVSFVKQMCTVGVQAKRSWQREVAKARFFFSALQVLLLIYLFLLFF
jgi:hypothetical protein